MRLLGLILAALVACVSCNNSDPKGAAEEFGVSTSVVECTDLGGSVKIKYHLKEYVGSVMPAIVEEVDWITDVDNTKRGEITFRVLPNYDTESRETVVELRYLNVDARPRVTIRQSGQQGDKLNIEIASISYSECSVKIEPQHDTMSYIVMMAEKAYFRDSNITDEISLVDADKALFNSYVVGGTLEDFLTQGGLALQGAKTKKWEGLSPAKEYIIYAYGVYISDDVYERVTPVYHLAVDKRLPERTAQNFDVNIEANGPEVEFNIAPQGWDGYYMVQIVEDSEAGYIEQGLPLGVEFEDAVSEAFFYISDHLFYFEEKSAEEIMAQLGYRGEVSFAKTLNANHRFMAIIYAIEAVEGGVPMMVSNATVKYFSTGSVERSDMTFDVKFENIKPRSVDISIVPSKDESYTAVMMFANNLPVGDKQEQLDYVISKYEPLELRGVYKEHIDQLPPETEFVIAVCGYYAGVPTTDLFVYRFATAKDGVGANEVIKAEFSAYDIAEVAALEPYYKSMLGYADYFLSMELTAQSAAPSLHFELYAKSQYDSYTHEDIRESMLEYAYTSSPDWALCSYGNEYILCALAEDENGYVGDMYVSEPIMFTREQTSNAAIFVELYKEYVGPKALIFRK